MGKYGTGWALEGYRPNLIDQPNPSHVTRILICRAKSRKKNIWIYKLYSQWRRPSSSWVRGRKNLVLTQDFYVIDEDVDEAEENLTQQIARKMEDALNDKQDSNEFEDQFDKDEKKQLTRI